VTIQIKTRVYKTEKRAREKYNAIVELEKKCHSDWKTYPKLTYHPSYKMWTLTQTIVYERKKPGRKRKRR
jgi:hypothetical protein